MAKRPLDEVYPIAFIDAIYFSVKNDGIVKKKAVYYIVLAINTEGLKDVLGICLLMIFRLTESPLNPH